MKRRSPEGALQKAVAEYLRVALKPPAFWTSIGHGGGGLVRGAILKARGLKPGIPDVLIVHDGRCFWIELKSATGRLSPEQTAVRAQLEAAGGYWAMCRSLDDVISQCRAWMLPVR